MYVAGEEIMNVSDRGLIRLVASFKLLKVATLIVTGLGLLKLIHGDVGRQLDHWISMLGFDPGNHYLNGVIRKATSLPPKRIEQLGIVSFIYAGLFLTEGIGLWLEKRWGEWFTVIITASLVPFEIYEMVSHPTVIKALVLILNVSILAYLLYRIRKEPRGRESGGGKTSRFTHGLGRT